MINKENKIPLYLQLVRVLVEKIKQGTYLEHEKLPSERALCDIYKVSRITVRQALNELEREGFIYKMHGKGTFVAPKAYNQKLDRLYSFTGEMKKLGKRPTTEILSFTSFEVDEQLAQKMNLITSDQVYQLVRLRLADGEPLMYETTFLPCKFFPDLLEVDLQGKPMYEVLQRNYDQAVTHATEQFTATLMREEEAKFLQGTSGQAAMFIKRFAYHGDQLIEYTRSIARGDKFAYMVKLE